VRRLNPRYRGVRKLNPRYRGVTQRYRGVRNPVVAVAAAVSAAGLSAFGRAAVLSVEYGGGGQSQQSGLLFSCRVLL